MSALLETTPDMTRKTPSGVAPGKAEATVTAIKQPAAQNLGEERIAYLGGLVRQAKAAAALFTQYSQEDVDRIVKPMVLAGQAHAQSLAQLAIQETRLGVLEDKYIKNMVATEFVYNYVKDKRSVGAIREFPERGLVEMAEPIGVIFSLIPITNPTSTVLFKCIMAIKTRNAVVFSPHPYAARCSREAVRIMYEAAVKYGAPEGVFTCLESHNLQDNAYLMHHKDVGLIDATGGPSVVKAAHSSGKPALGVGPGNTPVYLEKSADLNMAVVDIITSKTFDNGTICASEQTVVIDDEIYDAVLKKFSELGVHICNEEETQDSWQYADRCQHRLHAADGRRAEGNRHRAYPRHYGQGEYQAAGCADPGCGPRPSSFCRETVPRSFRLPRQVC